MQVIKAGERATWPKIPAIGTTTRIGYTLDRILNDFDFAEDHWLRSAPQTDAARKGVAAGRKNKAATGSKKRAAVVTE